MARKTRGLQAISRILVSFQLQESLDRNTRIFGKSLAFLRIVMVTRELTISFLIVPSRHKTHPALNRPLPLARHHAPEIDAARLPAPVSRHSSEAGGKSGRKHVLLGT
jgi:hypothetical protein